MARRQKFIFRYRILYCSTLKIFSFFAHFVNTWKFTIHSFLFSHITYFALLFTPYERELTTTKQQIITVYARVGGTYGLRESRRALRAPLSAPLPVFAGKCLVVVATRRRLMTMMMLMPRPVVLESLSGRLLPWRFSKISSDRPSLAFLFLAFVSEQSSRLVEYGDLWLNGLRKKKMNIRSWPVTSWCFGFFKQADVNCVFQWLL